MLLGQSIMPVASFSRLQYERTQLLQPRAQFNPWSARHAPSLTQPQFRAYSGILCPPTFYSFRPAEFCLNPVGVPLLLFRLLYPLSSALVGHRLFRQGDDGLGGFIFLLCCVLTECTPLGRLAASNRSHRLYLYLKKAMGARHGTKCLRSPY